MKKKKILKKCTLNRYCPENSKVNLEKNKEKLQQQVQDCYENISEEEKDRKRGYGRN